jgi:hypothetical protein
MRIEVISSFSCSSTVLYTLTNLMAINVKEPETEDIFALLHITSLFVYTEDIYIYIVNYNKIIRSRFLGQGPKVHLISLHTAMDCSM